MLRIRIRIRIRMTLGLPDPHPDPSINKQKLYQKSFFLRIWIRIRRIHMFLGLPGGSEDPDLHPDPYQNVTDPQQCYYLRILIVIFFSWPGFKVESGIIIPDPQWMVNIGFIMQD